MAKYREILCLTSPVLSQQNFADSSDASKNDSFLVSKCLDIPNCMPGTIIDNAQVYFDVPLEGVDTLYTCRKFLGVSDGAFLYTDTLLSKELPLDKSYDRMFFCWDGMNVLRQNFTKNTLIIIIYLLMNQ